MTPAQMKKINGVGETKLKRYGTNFTQEIAAYVKKNPERQAARTVDDQSFPPE